MCITKNDCTRPWDICRLASSRRISSCPIATRPLRGSFLYEFFQASGNLSIRYDAIVRSYELANQTARPDSNAKTFALRTRYKRSGSIPDTLGHSRKKPQLSATAISYTRERPIRRSLAHRLDEFPVGYSSASCTPAALASASPTACHAEPGSRNCQPPPRGGWGIFNRNYGEIFNRS